MSYTNKILVFWLINPFASRHSPLAGLLQPNQYFQGKAVLPEQFLASKKSPKP